MGRVLNFPSFRRPEIVVVSPGARDTRALEQGIGG